MRKLLKRRLLGIPLVAIVAVVLAAGVALAVYTATIPSSVTVVSNETIGLYGEAECTTEVTSIAWGEVMQGASPTQEVYVKNEGGVIVDVTVSSPDLASLVGTLSATPVADLAPGDVQLCTLTLAIDAVAIPGDVTFDITFDSNQVP